MHNAHCICRVRCRLAIVAHSATMVCSEFNIQWIIIIIICVKWLFAALHVSSSYEWSMVHMWYVYCTWMNAKEREMKPSAAHFIFSITQLYGCLGFLSWRLARMPLTYKYKIWVMICACSWMYTIIYVCRLLCFNVMAEKKYAVFMVNFSWMLQWCFVGVNKGFCIWIDILCYGIFWVLSIVRYRKQSHIGAALIWMYLRVLRWFSSHPQSFGGIALLW